NSSYSIRAAMSSPPWPDGGQATGPPLPSRMPIGLVEGGRVCVGAAADDLSQARARELPAAHRDGAVDDDVVDALGLGVQPPRPAGQVVAHRDVVARDRRWVEHHEVGVPPLGDPTSVLETV